MTPVELHQLILSLGYPVDFAHVMYNNAVKHPELISLEGFDKLKIPEYSDSFFEADVTADTSVDTNANVCDHDIVAHSFEVFKPHGRLRSYHLLWQQLKETYGEDKATALIYDQYSGRIYINDFGDISRPYCFNYSVYDIAMSGLPMIKKIKSVAPKHLFALKSQLEQFIVIASNSTLGATGLADLFPVMAGYVEKILETGEDAHFKFAYRIEEVMVCGEHACGLKKKKVVDEDNVWVYVRETLASLIYTLNQPMRGNQSPFTNVSVYDREFLKELLPFYPNPVTGKVPDIETVMKLQDVFLEVMNHELARTPVTFPVTTACFAVDDEGNILDDEFLNLVAYSNHWFGFINIYCGKSSTIASCCRLRSETDNEYFNSFGAGSTKIGSLGVVTLNFPRMAHNAVTEDEFLRELAYAVEDAAMINNAKREIIKRRIEQGAMPLYDLGYMSITKQYSTVGVNGLNEALVYLGYDITTSQGEAFAKKVMYVINSKNAEMQRIFRAPHNCEQVPAENSAIKLATKDRVLGFNSTYDFYSNQFIPLITKAGLMERIRLQGQFDGDFGGGAIAHLNFEEPLDADQMAWLIRHCAKQGVVYWAANYPLQMCAEGHMTVGKREVCHCGAEITDTYTRVVGFLTNTKHWHKVRRLNDYPVREFYKEV